MADRLVGEGPRQGVTNAHRSHAEALDAADPLAEHRAAFVFTDEAIYLDGNSLGRLPKATADRLTSAIRNEWGGGLVRSWPRWIGLPTDVGDRLGRAFLGAAPGQVIVCDSTTVNLYKLGAAALARQCGPVVVDASEFPTDRYVFEGLAASAGVEVRSADDETALDGASLVVRSLVDYRTAQLRDLEAETARIHEAGALVLWDLSHAVASVRIELDRAGADMAVGCTYKHLSAGPGAPAFIYIREDLQPQLRQPIWGWFGQRDQFAMGPEYDPEPGIAQMMTGTPDVLGLLALRTSIDVLGLAGIDALHAKAVALGDLAIFLADVWLAPLGFVLGSPRSGAFRGSHVALRHRDALRMCKALVAEGVVPDFRGPDMVRIGFGAASTRFVDVWDGLNRLRRIAEDGTYRNFDDLPGRVT